MNPSWRKAVTQDRGQTGEKVIDPSTVSYKYDKISELTIADSSVNTEDRGYTYDTAWNLYPVR